MIAAQDCSLELLFEAAVRALELEDRRLALAFAQARPQRLPWHRGLAYGTFETTLVYEIFKAWLPIAEVYWEHPYPDAPGLKADLVVFDQHGPSAVVEAKWWMNNHQKTLAALEQDVIKLRSWNGPIRDRILLCFWYSPEARWDQDLTEVRTFCGASGPNRTELLYFARFPTHLVNVPAAYFACAALGVK